MEVKLVVWKRKDLLELVSTSILVAYPRGTPRLEKNQRIIWRTRIKSYFC